MQINDARISAIETILGVEPGSSSHNDLVLAWLQLNGASSSDLNDAWLEMLSAQLAEPIDSGLQRNDLWRELLRRLGYTGAYNDAELSFWRDGLGIIP